jgi:NodT family efflux transporter outer membrane factor (OMF) lipoprotein
MVFLAGCAVGPSYKPPSIAVPPDWNQARGELRRKEDSSLERWWAEFRDPTLESLVRRAVESNLDLEVASARILEARAARGIAASAALPQVDARGAYARTQRSEAVPPFDRAGGEGSPFGDRQQDAFVAGFDASFELDLFGGVKRDVEAAVAQIQAMEESRRDVLLTLVADVARVYTELRGAQRRLRILDDVLLSQRDTLDIVKARFEAGLVAALDVSFAEGFLAATESRRPVLERSIQASIHRLGVLLGREPTSLLRELEPVGEIPLVPPEIPASLPSELLSRRPDLRRAERELAAATARIGVARADLFPRFSITGSFGRLSDDPSELARGSSDFWSIVPGFRWPVLSGGRIRANVRVQEARAEQALLRYRSAVLTALEEVENALSAYTRERRREKSLEQAVLANRRALELARQRYVSGLESFLSVLDAERSLDASEDAWVESQTSSVVALIALYKSLGGGWQSGHLRRSRGSRPAFAAPGTRHAG